MGKQREMLLEQEDKGAGIPLTPEQQGAFYKAVKTGVYKSLHQRGLLTDGQLFVLLSRLERQE